MSRIGKSPITLNTNINITIEKNNITIKGPKGQLKYILSNHIGVKKTHTSLIVYRKDNSKKARQLHGLSRTILNNMVIGVSEGFCKLLEIQGIGYRAQINKNNILTLNVGYSHPVSIQAPPDIYLKVDNSTLIKVEGINKEIVGQVASKIRSIKPPEPYKGKGIRYKDEIVRTKVGKAGK